MLEYTKVYGWGAGSLYYFNITPMVIKNSLYIDAFTGIQIMPGLSGGTIINTSLNLFSYMLGQAQILSWGLLPLCWGFLWATKFQKRGGLFLLTYSAYLILPVISFMELHNIRATYQFKVDYLIPYCIVGLAGLYLSAILFITTMLLWQKRQ